MREIKFRAKHYGKWIYGNGIIPVEVNCKLTGKYEMVQYVEYDELDGFAPLYITEEINIETLGQYTGLKDRHKVEIYEGDIVYCQTKFGKAKAIIEFINGKFVARFDSAVTHPQNGHYISYYDINKRFEVIGNIYDDPELLKESS